MTLLGLLVSQAFHMILKKCTVVFLRGQSTYQIVTVSEGDNSTVLAALSGIGETLPPMIIEK